MAFVETTDHDDIREWIENQNGHPAKLSDQILDRNSLRLKFDNIRQSEDLEKVSWEEFFGLFEEEGAVFRYEQDSNSTPEQSYEFEFNERGAMQDETGTEMESDHVQDNMRSTEPSENSTGNRTTAEREDSIRDTQDT